MDVGFGADGSIISLKRAGGGVTTMLADAEHDKGQTRRLGYSGSGACYKVMGQRPAAGLGPDQ